MRLSHIAEIEEHGYTKIRAGYSTHTINEALDKIKHLYETTPRLADQYVPRLNKSSPNLYNLQNKDFFFIDLLLGNDEIDGILRHFLNDPYYKTIPQSDPNYVLRHMGARSSGEALVPHIDNFIPFIGPKPLAMQVAIMLEESTPENGCTTVLPGSHQSGRYASLDDIENLVPLAAKPGDVLIWDSRLIHSTTKNTSGNTRWSIVSTFTIWAIKQMFRTTQSLPREFYEKLTEKQKTVLGYRSISAFDEFEYIDPKTGY